METPVLYCVFNRLDVVKKCFEPIRNAKPKKLYIASDGPRKDREGEAELVQACRNYVLEHIDWDCDVKTLFRSENLSCQRAISDATRWFFNQEEAGIIIEDDVLTSPQFFEFMEAMLEKYKDDDRVGYIVGYNYKFLLDSVPECSEDYVFTAMGQLWGWASWRRAVMPHGRTAYDYSVERLYSKEFLKVKNMSKLLGIGARFDLLLLLKHLMRISNARDFDYAIYTLLNGAVAIMPVKNLTSHLGLGGYNVKDENPFDVPIEDLDCSNLKHPKKVEINVEYNSKQSEFSFLETKNIYGNPSTSSVDFKRINSDIFRSIFRTIRFCLKYNFSFKKEKRKKNYIKYQESLAWFENIFSFWLYSNFYYKR